MLASGPQLSRGVKTHCSQGRLTNRQTEPSSQETDSMLVSLVLPAMALACVTVSGSAVLEDALRDTEGGGKQAAGQGSGRRPGHSEPLLANHDQLLQLQATVDDHDQLLHDAHTLIRQQAAQLSRQQDLLSQQAAELSHQQQLLQRQAALLTGLTQHDQPRHGQVHGEGEDSVHPASPGDRRTARHDVRTRSYELAPLQAAVDHLGQQLSQVWADMGALQVSAQQGPAGQGTTFIHWGNHQCPTASQLVYSGVVGGGNNGHVGGATNYLCLTMHPVLSNHTLPPGVGYLYGSEYQTYDEHDNKDPVCSVCRSTQFSNTIMVPGTNVCTDGWHLQYSGFLMAGYYAQASGSEFICVDSSMESRIGGDANQDGRLLYFAVTRCGSLPCEPYVHNKVVTCAVCSR